MMKFSQLFGSANMVGFLGSSLIGQSLLGTPGPIACDLAKAINAVKIINLNIFTSLIKTANELREVDSPAFITNSYQYQKSIP